MEIIDILNKWYDIYASAYISSFMRKEYNDKIYYYLTTSINMINAYKFCKLVQLAKRTPEMQNKLITFIKVNTFSSISILDLTMINEYMTEYYRINDRKYSTNIDYNICADLIYVYSKFLFNVVITRENMFKFKNLTLPQAKFLLNYNQYRNYSNPIVHKSIVKFVLACKKLNIPNLEISTKLGIESHYYVAINPQFYHYLKYDNPNNKKYLARKQFIKSAIDCMEYLRAVYNTSLDLDGDVVISADSIKQIMTIANIDQHLNSSS